MTVAELTQDVQFTVDQSGQVRAVVVAPELWQRIIAALEDSEDYRLVESLRSRLARGPVAAGAIRWQEVADEWQ